MDKYMMIFRNTPTSEEQFQSMSPEDMQASLDKWNTWIGGIAAQGKLVGSDALEGDGKILTGSRRALSDGPYVEGKELVSGYLVMEAASEAEAVEAAKGCPIFEVEGSVEVRKLMIFE
ncbi:MAG: YciI family protein [Bacteroidetes bacterium]|nr:YciI family protein [Bacteroidota bacterium]